MSKQRLHHFDVIKGIAILLVVMGHTLIMGIHSIDKAFLFKLIEKLHMPLFFFISGYFSFKMSENKVCIPNLWTRFKQLIIPFLCVSALWIYYFPHSGIQSPLNSTWEGLYSDVWKNGYWFTLCLFEIITIYSLLVALSNNFKNSLLKAILFIVVFALIMMFSKSFDFVIIDYLSIELIVKFMPIFIVGVLAHKFEKTFNEIITNNSILTLSILLGSITIYFACYFWEFPETMSNYEFIISIISQISLVIIVFSVIKPWSESEFSKTRPSWIIKKLEFVGKESLTIYLLHYFFLFPMTWLREPVCEMALGFVPLFVISLLTAIVIITITLGVGHIISKSRLFSLLLLGKN